MQANLTDVKYLGSATIARLSEHGITTVEQLISTPLETLIAIPGIGEHTAPLILASANELLPPASTAEVVTANPAVQTTDDTTVEKALDNAEVGEAQTELLEEADALSEEGDDASSAIDAAADQPIIEIMTPPPTEELSEKQIKKQAKKAKKALKKAAKKAKKLEKAAKKQVKKAEKKAKKKAKKQAKKNKKQAAS